MKLLKAFVRDRVVDDVIRALEAARLPRHPTEPRRRNINQPKGEEKMKRTLTILTMAFVTLAMAGAMRASSEAVETAEVLELYQQIHSRLADDSIEGVAEAAAAITEEVQPCDCASEEKTVYEALGAAARGMTGSDLATLRGQFKGLSTAMADWVSVVGAETTQLYFCPMAKAYWMQKRSDDGTRNPYYGKSMLKCGDKVEKITE